MKEMLKLKRIYLILLTPLTLLLLLFAKLDSYWVEHLFVPFVYKPISIATGGFMSLFPFSITELCFVLLCILAVIYLVKFIKNFSKQTLFLTLVNLLCVGSVVFFLFEITMGLNYYRKEAKDYLGITPEPASATELYDVCVILVRDMDKYYTATRDTDFEYMSECARDAYQKLSEKYPVLKTANIRNKPLVSSKLFSCTLTTGLYMPILCESNINVDVPVFTVPATMCHELTHYRGFMRENEANFLGYLACLESDRADFKYSGAYTAFNYCFSALYDEDITLAKKIANMLPDGVLSDIRTESEYWDKYQNTVVSDLSGQVYEEYLNANGQSSGLKSYGEMVDLLIAYYKKGM